LVSRKVPVILDVLMKSEFFRHVFEKRNQISNFAKIPPVGAQLFRRAGGRTIVAFHISANEPKNVYVEITLYQARKRP